MDGFIIHRLNGWLPRRENWPGHSGSSRGEIQGAALYMKQHAGATYINVETHTHAISRFSQLVKTRNSPLDQNLYIWMCIALYPTKFVL